MAVIPSTPEHEAVYQDIVNVLRKHDKCSNQELLAIVSNIVGKLIALQDQRKITKEHAMQIVLENIDAGNQQVLNALKNPEGAA